MCSFIEYSKIHLEKLSEKSYLLQWMSKFVFLWKMHKIFVKAFGGRQKTFDGEKVIKKLSTGKNRFFNNKLTYAQSYPLYPQFKDCGLCKTLTNVCSVKNVKNEKRKGIPLDKSIVCYIVNKKVNIKNFYEKSGNLQKIF